MIEVGYLFERFPSFTQTFCYREVRELRRQGIDLSIFSIRQPTDEPAQDWDPEIVRQVRYLPVEEKLLEQVGRQVRRRELPAAVGHEIDKWGRQTDFLRLYQAAYVGWQLRQKGKRRLHAHFAGMAARTAYWIRKFFGIEYSFTAHANDIFAPRPFAIDLKKLIESARAVVTESDHAADFLKRSFPSESNKIQRVYNGLDVGSFRLADFASPRPVIVSIGRLVEKKGFGDLVEACRLLKQRGRSFRCEIIGEGPLEAVLRGQATAAGLTDEELSLTGPLPQPEVTERLARASLFVLPCVPEAAGGMDNLPTVIMEAMASGLPVISTPVAGIPEMVEADKTGLLVPSRNPPALATAIEQLIDDSGRAREFGHNGRLRAAERFDIEESARALIQLF
jgi:glycosyltransferase involved in cell wall biosynthesis